MALEIIHLKYAACEFILSEKSALREFVTSSESGLLFSVSREWMGRIFELSQFHRFLALVTNFLASTTNLLILHAIFLVYVQ